MSSHHPLRSQITTITELSAGPGDTLPITGAVLCTVPLQGPNLATTNCRTRRTGFMRAPAEVGWHHVCETGNVAMAENRTRDTSRRSPWPEQLYTVQGTTAHCAPPYIVNVTSLWLGLGRSM
eukprot:scpid107697/ scgid13024/ 